MRPVLFISLLLLSTLLYEVQGRHLRKGGDLPARNHKTNENGSIRRSGEKKIDACKDGQCSSSSSASAGKNRKLIAKTTSSTYSTTTTSKNLIKNEGTKANTIPKDKSSSESLGVKKENFSVNSSPETGHRKTSNEHYPNVFDLAGMDYSPARRKAPIHN